MLRVTHDDYVEEGPIDNSAIVTPMDVTPTYSDEQLAKMQKLAARPDLVRKL